MIAVTARESEAHAPVTLVRRSLRPRLRPANLAEAPRRAAAAAAPAPQAVPAALQADFNRWIAGFRGRALSAGVSGAVFDRAFAGVEYLPQVVKRDGNQSEFTTSTGDYLSRAVSDSRVRNGRAAAAEQAGRLNAIAARYDVPGHYVAAVWGMESNYGANRGNTPLISALATLAHDGRRGAFFEKQLIAALKILQNGDVRPEDMTGSWAGAMGHTQFIPTSYAAYAVDFTGDGRRDIWSDDPTDALASTAAYLAKAGWIPNMPWGVEVIVPRDFNFALAHGPKKMPSEWERLGLRAADGGRLRDHGSAKLLLPSGAQGVAFLTFRNFDVIKRYNNSDAYALGVGHLGDRIAGAGPLKGSWPEGDHRLKRAEREEVQRLLARRGFDPGGVDGRLGPNSIRAIRAFQSSAGLVPDGHPSVPLLQALRR
nr:lytic murein transglycosylase [Pseudooceanicola aestuarii]